MQLGHIKVMVTQFYYKDRGQVQYQQQIDFNDDIAEIRKDKTKNKGFISLKCLGHGIWVAVTCSGMCASLLPRGWVIL